MMLLHIKKTTDTLSKEEKIYQFLSERKTGVLATTSAEGNPYASVLYYSVDASLNIRFMTKGRTRKNDNIEHNNHAVLVVYDEAKQTTIEISGMVSKITDHEESHEVFRNALRASLHTAENAVPPISKLAAGDYIAYKLTPTEIKMAAYKRRSSEREGGIFEVVNLSPLKLGT